MCVKDLKIISHYYMELSIAQLVERMTVVVSSCYHQVAGSIPARETFLEGLFENSNHSKNIICVIIKCVKAY